MPDIDRLMRDEHAAALAIRRATKTVVRKYVEASAEDRADIQAFSVELGERFIDCYYRLGLVGGGKLSLRSVAKVFETLTTSMTEGRQLELVPPPDDAA
jgi:hypothetical protein